MKSFYYKFSIVLFALALSGCKTSLSKGEVDTETQEGRIKVVSDQIYTDSSGTGYMIFVLFDTISGKEFISIPGSGIARIE